MNHTPETPKPAPKPASERTAFDAPAASTDASTSATSETERAALEAKMALLPDYGDEAFPSRSPRSSRASATPGDVQHNEAQKPGSPLSAVIGGFLGGALANMALGFLLLGAQRVGLTLDGPGVIAVVVALVILALLLGSWPRRVWLGAGGFLLGLVLSFAALFLFVRPLLLDSATSTRAPSAAPDIPPDSSASPS